MRFRESKLVCRSLLISFLAFAFFLGGAKSAWAAASHCSGGGVTTIVTLPSTVAVPRDAPVGSTLVPWTMSSDIGSFTCDFDLETVGSYALPTLSGGTLSPVSYGTTPGNGATAYKVYQTNVPGIGIAIAFNALAGGCGYLGWKDVLTPDGGTRPIPWVGWGCTNQSGMHGVVRLAGKFAVAVVKTDAVTATGMFAGELAQATLGVTTDGAVALDLPGVVRDSLVITSAAIVPRACTTPNVVVPLGRHMQSEFMGEGYTTAAVRFQIDLNNCPAGMTSIAYRIDGATTVLDATQSVVALDGSSSATGVGVQLLDGSGTTGFPLGRAVNFEGYDPHAGGSYSIPLKARYYQTGSSVGVGPANTSMTFTMIYE